MTIRRISVAMTTLVLATISAWAQSPTKDAGRQFTGVLDAAAASRTAPARAGTSLPAMCTIGDMFYKTDATAGQNLYGCTATNTWTAQAGSAGAGAFQSTITDLVPSRATVTNANDRLVIGAGRCWGANKTQATATITAGSGSGSWVAYCTDTQTIAVEHSTSAGLTITCSGCYQIQVATPQVPQGLYAIGSGSLASGGFSTLSDDREFMTGHRHQNGVGMDTLCTSGVCVDQVNTATVQLKSDNYTPVGQFDTSGATLTKPMKTGTSVPGSCTTGEFFYKTDAAAGSRIYECVSGTFSLFSGGGGGTDVISRFFPVGAVSAAGNFTPLWETQSTTIVEAVFTLNSSKRAGFQFPDAATTSADFAIVLPTNWTGAVDVTIYANQAASGSPTGNWVFQIQTGCADNIAPTFNAGQTATIAVPAINTTTTASWTNITTTSCTASNPMWLRLSRLGSNAGDTGNTDPNVFGATVTYRSN